MLYRKIINKIENYFKSHSNKMLIVDGARQVGKSFIIRYVGKKMFQNYIEVNMEKDRQKERLFANTKTVDDFYMVLSMIAGNKLGQRDDTLVFIDEIQAYDHLLTMVKFLMEDGRFTYIASGSQLGMALKTTQSIPIGSIEIEHLYPLDFEEFIIANNVGSLAIDAMRESFKELKSLPEAIHNKIMNLFRVYLLIGGMPEAVNVYLAEHNIVSVRKVQKDIHTLYGRDTAKYESNSNKKLNIQRIYDMIPSNLENKKKRVVAKNIDGKIGNRMSNYTEEFEYLTAAGIALEVQAISQPTFPLIQNIGKNLLKLYMNDVGIFTGIIYRNNIKPITDDSCSVNLGSIYETVVAQELRAHGFNLCYYDNKKYGEVDYIIDDVDNLSTIPIEVKSGKDYTVHSALNHFVSVKDYNIKKAFVLCNKREISTNKNGITYIPIYYIMFFEPGENASAEFIEV